MTTLVPDTKRILLLDSFFYVTQNATSYHLGPVGSGGGTSGRAMAFCLGRPGLNPGLDFGFFSVQNCCLTGCRAFSINV